MNATRGMQEMAPIASVSFFRPTGRLYKMWPSKLLSTDELHVILKVFNLELTEQLSFFNYLRKCF